MMSVVRIAPEDASHHVRLTLTMPDGAVRQLSPAGLKILSVLGAVASRIGHDITVTSAMDGQHSGPDDPHEHGDALDVRTHDLPDAKAAVTLMQLYLGEKYFYVFLEDAGTPNEHAHAQKRKSVAYPPVSLTEDIT